MNQFSNPCCEKWRGAEAVAYFSLADDALLQWQERDQVNFCPVCGHYLLDDAEETMPRNMSFYHTQEQCWKKTKTETRRLGWWFLKKGDIVQQVVKAQGLKKSEKVEKLHLIRITGTRPEILSMITPKSVEREGFPEMTPGEFVKMFCDMNKCSPNKIINRIKFEYL